MNLRQSFIHTVNKGGNCLICPICNNSLIYQSSCDPQDIYLEINGYIIIYICSKCDELFNLINNHDTYEIKLEQYKSVD